MWGLPLKLKLSKILGPVSNQPKNTEKTSLCIGHVRYATSGKSITIKPTAAEQKTEFLVNNLRYELRPPNPIGKWQRVEDANESWRQSAFQV